MSLLTSQMTSKMSTAYSGLSALIQAATSQLSDLSEESTPAINTPAGTPTLLSNPTTPTIDGAHLDLDRTSSWHQKDSEAATVTPVLASNQNQGSGNPTKLFFPEVLMLLLANPANEDIVTFLPDGKYFAIRRLVFSNELLYKHFQLACFEDFLQETRGWGFIRVNGNITTDHNSNSNSNSNINDGNCDASPNSNTSNAKADIYVFRHPHFEKNRPVDMAKIGFRNRDTMKCGSSRQFSRERRTKHRTLPEENTNSEGNSSKRHLCSSNTGEFEDNRQRLKIESNSLSGNVDSFPTSASSSEPPSQQLRRQSSLELRGVAEAITASKLHFKNSKEGDESNKDSRMICDTDNTIYPQSGLDHMRPQHERRLSTASSLVDGGVETATQNIVTDAIEALLFDETHTRETYHRHEKELSVSSLPGVVPISKQLFSASESDNAVIFANEKIKKTEASGATKKKSSVTRKEIKKRKSQSLSSPPSPLMIRTTMNSLEDASRNNDDLSSSSSPFSSKSRLRVIIPNDGCGKEQQRESKYGSMVVSPARMEAAAALVSQSRNRSDEF